jgi:hypothetical protein
MRSCRCGGQGWVHAPEHDALSHGARSSCRQGGGESLSPDWVQEEGGSEQPAEPEPDAEHSEAHWQMTPPLGCLCRQLPVQLWVVAPVSRNERQLVMSRCADMNKWKPEPEEKMGQGRRPVTRTWQKLRLLEYESRVGACPLLVKMALSIAQ